MKRSLVPVVLLWVQLVFCAPVFGSEVSYYCSDIYDFYTKVIRKQLNAPDVERDCTSKSGRLAWALYALYHEAHPLYQFIRENIRGIRLEADDLIIKGGKANAIADFRTLVIKAYPTFWKESIVRIMATLVHEASHFYLKVLHVECLAGPFKGGASCDDRFTAGYIGGPTNFELSALKYLRNLPNRPDWIKGYQIRWEMDDALSRINYVNGDLWDKWFYDERSLVSPPLRGDLAKRLPAALAPPPAVEKPALSETERRLQKLDRSLDQLEETSRVLDQFLTELRAAEQRKAWEKKLESRRQLEELRRWIEKK